MRDLNFTHLYYFVTIATEGSIVNASKKLNITQPALSHMLKQLEEHLETKLFERKSRKLILTTEGAYLKTQAEKIFRLTHESLIKLKSGFLDEGKIFKIGLSPWIPNDIIFQLLKKPINSNNIQIEIFQKSTTGLLKDLEQLNLDAVFSDSPLQGRKKDMIAYPVLEDPIFCVASPKTAKNLKKQFPKNLKHQRIIGYAEACQLRDVVDQYMNYHEIDSYVAARMSDSALISKSCEQSPMVGFLPKSVVKEAISEGRLKKLGQLKTQRFQLWLLINKNAIPSSLLKHVLGKKRKL